VRFGIALEIDVACQQFPVNASESRQ
jgi:hypothetical protein